MKTKRNDYKKMIGDILVKLGERAVGKCLIPGMFDPQIPKELKTVPEIIKSIQK